MQIPKRKSENKARKIFDPYITQSQADKLKVELEKIKNIQQPQAAEEVKRLAEMGDFSENAAYSMAKSRLRWLIARAMEIEDQLAHSIIIKPIKGSKVVTLGSKVTVKTDGYEKTFTILGSAETNPSAGMISQNSPLGRALIGRKVGDEVKIKLKNREVNYKILKIE